MRTTGRCSAGAMVAAFMLGVIVVSNVDGDENKPAEDEAANLRDLQQKINARQQQAIFKERTANLERMLQPRMMANQLVFGIELSFAKEYCQPDEQRLLQMKRLARVELKALQEAVQKSAMEPLVQNVIRDGKAFRIIHQGIPKQQDDEPLIEAAILRIVSQVFPREMAKSYVKEREQRKEFRAETGAAELVMILDERFLLTEEQRNDLTESIAAVWKDEWRFYSDVLSNNPQYFPPVPDEAVVTFLDKSQQQLWRNWQRPAIRINANQRNNDGIFRNVDVRPNFDWFEERDEDVIGEVDDG